jgi:hypothetical protein
MRCYLSDGCEGGANGWRPRGGFGISGVACKLAGRERAASVQNSRNTGYASNVSKILRVK